MRATFSGIAKIVVLALGVSGFVASAGSASAADACKTYVKANYAKPARRAVTDDGCGSGSGTGGGAYGEVRPRPEGADSDPP